MNVPRRLTGCAEGSSRGAGRYPKKNRSGEWNPLRQELPIRRSVAFPVPALKEHPSVGVDHAPTRDPVRTEPLFDDTSFDPDPAVIVPIAGDARVRRRGRLDHYRGGSIDLDIGVITLRLRPKWQQQRARCNQRTN